MRPTARSFVFGYFQDSRLTEVLVATFWRRPFEPMKPEQSFACISLQPNADVLPQLFTRPPPSPRYMKDLRNRTWSSKPVVANLCCCKEGAGTASPLASVGAGTASPLAQLGETSTAILVGSIPGGAARGVSLRLPWTSLRMAPKDIPTETELPSPEKNPVYSSAKDASKTCRCFFETTLGQV